MNTKHPITPPEELVEEWGRTVLIDYSDTHWGYEQILCAMAARWGADQELEACIDVLGGQWEWDVLSQCTGWKEFRDQSEEIIRAARRPKPPSLKEQALAVLDDCSDRLEGAHENTIRRALEALDG